MTGRTIKTLLLAPVVAVEIVAAIFAWRDLTQRPDAAIRGPKKLWRIALLANPGNSVGYWTIGRR